MALQRERGRAFFRELEPGRALGRLLLAFSRGSGAASRPNGRRLRSWRTAGNTAWARRRIGSGLVEEAPGPAPQCWRQRPGSAELAALSTLKTAAWNARALSRGGGPEKRFSESAHRHRGPAGAQTRPAWPGLETFCLRACGAVFLACAFVGPGERRLGPLARPLGPGQGGRARGPTSPARGQRSAGRSLWRPTRSRNEACPDRVCPK